LLVCCAAKKKKEKLEKILGERLSLENLNMQVSSSRFPLSARETNSATSLQPTTRRSRTQSATAAAEMSSYHRQQTEDEDNNDENNADNRDHSDHSPQEGGRGQMGSRRRTQKQFKTVAAISCSKADKQKLLQKRDRLQKLLGAHIPTENLLFNQLPRSPGDSPTSPRLSPGSLSAPPSARRRAGPWPFTSIGRRRGSTSSSEASRESTQEDSTPDELTEEDETGSETLGEEGVDEEEEEEGEGSNISLEEEEEEENNTEGTSMDRFLVKHGLTLRMKWHTASAGGAEPKALSADSAGGKLRKRQKGGRGLRDLLRGRKHDSAETPSLSKQNRKPEERRSREV